MIEELNKKVKDLKMDWRTEKFIKEFSNLYKTCKVNCTQYNCPAFTSCPQIASHFKPFGEERAKIFFVCDSVPSEEEETLIPMVNNAGRYYRRMVIDRLAYLGQPTSHLITKTFRSGRNPTKSSSTCCWNLFYRELLQHRPELVVAIGIKTFSSLYERAKNKEDLPPKEEQNLISLRGKHFQFEFEGEIKTTVYISFHPSLVMDNPTAGRFIKEDFEWIYAFSKKQPILKKKPVIINNITLIKNVNEALGYLDFLCEEGADQNVVVFDTETLNLNKKFNNAFLTWQFSHSDGDAVVIPIEHPYLPLFKDKENKLKLREKANKFFNLTSEQSKLKWIVAHYAKFDLAVMLGLFDVISRHKDSIPIWCTFLGMHWLDENRKKLSEYLPKGKGPYSLKLLGEEFFGFKYKSEHLESREEGDLKSLTINELADYGGSDVILTRALFFKQLALAKAQPGNALEKLEKFQKYYYSPLSRALAMLECNGIYAKKEQLDYLQGEDSPIWNRMDTLFKDLQTTPEILDFKTKYSSILSGDTTDIEYEEDLWGSTTQVNYTVDLNKQDQQDAFYLDYLKLAPLKRSKVTDEASIDKKFLEHYGDPIEYKKIDLIKTKYGEFYSKPISVDDDGKDVYKINPIIMDKEYRELKKLGTGYCVKMQEMLEDKENGDCLDSRIRANYNPAGTDTGRLSSNSPNLQQLPAGRTKHAKEVKNMFQAEPGTVLFQLDYKTAEVRWAAIFSKDDNLIKLFNESSELLAKACSSDDFTDQEVEAAALIADIHRKTAALMFGVPVEKVPKQLRQATKSITFGLLFGMAAQTLANRNDWTLEDAEEKLKKYFAAFPRLEKWITDTKAVSKEQGYVETFMGRRRRLDHLYATGEWKHLGDAERRSANAPIQGQSSDAGNLGLCIFVQYLLDNNLEKKWKIENSVHDSCLIQLPLEDVETAIPIINHCFVKGMQNYIEEHWKVKLPIFIEAEFELGFKYGELKAWDGRQKTLKAILSDIKLKIEKEKQEAIEKKNRVKIPSENLDLVKWEG